MSAEIIQFIRSPKRNREQTDFPRIAFRSSLRGRSHDGSGPYGA
jgi:hypothetical protein